MDIRLLCDYRGQLITERVRLINRLRWHLLAIEPELEAQLSPAALDGPRIRARLAGQLRRQADSTQLRIAKAMLTRISQISRQESELEAELSALTQQHNPQLLAERGCGTITAAILIGHTAGAQRFATEAAFARHTGTAPIPASSGNTSRHRLHRGGDRQLNRAIHIIALSRARTDRPLAPASSANTPKARASAKRSAASSATSPAPCGESSTPPHRHPHSSPTRPLMDDIGEAMSATVPSRPLSSGTDRSDSLETGPRCRSHGFLLAQSR